MLGIMIGVAAVIAMLAIGNGAQASITGSIDEHRHEIAVCLLRQ